MRHLSALVVLCCLIGTLLPHSAAQAAESKLAFVERNGMVVIEAEHFDAAISRGKHSWQTRTDLPGFTGAGFVSSDPNKGTSFKPGELDRSPELHYRVQFDQVGTYYLWTRASGVNKYSDSAYVGFDDVFAFTLTGAPQDWAWTQRTAEQNATPSIVILKPGVHTIKFWAREDGYHLDRFILTNDSSYQPKGTDQPESARADQPASGGGQKPTSPPASTPPPVPTSPPASTPPPASAPPPAGNLMPAVAPPPLPCKSNELFMDTQDWWTNPDGGKGNDFGHLHTSVCFPYDATLKGTLTLTVRSVMHQNPGLFRQLQIQIYQGDSANVAAFTQTFRRTMKTCEESGGALSPDGLTCAWLDTIKLDTTKARYDGQAQFRFRGFVREPDGTEMRTSTSLHATLRNGKKWYDRLYQPMSETEARGWYTDANYSRATLRNVGDVMKPISGVWQPSITLDQGFEGTPATGWYAALDTDFHMANPGIPLCPDGVHGPKTFPQCSTKGRFNGRLRIDTTRLADGWHRLFLRTDSVVAKRSSTNSAVLALWFKVDNEQAGLSPTALLAASFSTSFCDGASASAAATHQ